jgi:diketogulonate reductase-like aldo/keto reductase
MPPKIILITATTLGSVGDTSIANIDSQVVTMGQLYKVVNQLTSNGVVLNNKINSIGMSKVKMPSIKRFSGEKVKLKGFLTQIKLKIRHKRQKLPIVADQVAYIGLFLVRQILEWFKLYLIKYEANSLITKNNEVRYMFLI